MSHTNSCIKAKCQLSLRTATQSESKTESTCVSGQWLPLCFMGYIQPSFLVADLFSNQSHLPQSHMLMTRRLWQQLPGAANIFHTDQSWCSVCQFTATWTAMLLVKYCPSLFLMKVSRTDVYSSCCIWACDVCLDLSKLKKTAYFCAAFGCSGERSVKPTEITLS